MNLKLDLAPSANYKSQPQIIRRVTESWVGNNLYCPRCGHSHINHFENNRPVADFFCPNCQSQFELKSKNGEFKNKIIGGAYKTMIERITSNENPDFLLLSYSETDYEVTDLFLIPKNFFTPNIIEQRKPLGPNARRAGWVGCNILLNEIPSQGRIPIIHNNVESDKNIVLAKTRTAQNLARNNLVSRGWMMDILSCVNSINSEIFTLNDIYRFESFLQQRHPDNHNIQAKIRQELQFLRDRHIIEFLGNGNYKK